MTKLTNEQIEQILEGAKKGWHKSYSTAKQNYEPYATVHNLDDLREILSLRQEVERLHTTYSVIDAAFKACNGAMPNKGVKVSGFINVSSYQGYLCKWNGTNPVALCKMQHFEKWASDKEQDHE